jgi:hypothetical protein
MVGGHEHVERFATQFLLLKLPADRQQRCGQIQLPGQQEFFQTFAVMLHKLRATPR